MEAKQVGEQVSQTLREPEIWLAHARNDVSSSDAGAPLSMAARPRMDFFGPPKKVPHPPAPVLGRRKIKRLKDAWLPTLAAIREEWERGLPAESLTSWPQGSVYACRGYEGSSDLGPDEQLQSLLAMLADRNVFVPSSRVFFDIDSGHDVGRRRALWDLELPAMLGKLGSVMGVFVGERLLRDLEQAIAKKRRYAMLGVELMYVGLTADAQAETERELAAPLGSW